MRGWTFPSVGFYILRYLRYSHIKPGLRGLGGLGAGKIAQRSSFLRWANGSKKTREAQIIIISHTETCTGCVAWHHSLSLGYHTSHKTGGRLVFSHPRGLHFKLFVFPYHNCVFHAWTLATAVDSVFVHCTVLHCL